MIKFLKILIAPSALIYWLIIRVRNFLFNKGIFPQVSVPVKVISVGNLTVGGSGKTPAVITLINILKKEGIKPGVLSRGYRRSSHGYRLVYDGKSEILPVNECGDEMYLVTDECRVPSAVAERRVKGAKQFLTDVDIQTIVLDDAYQHRWLARDLNILMFDQRFLLKTGSIEQKLLPLGVMRETFSDINRADIVIINRKFSGKKELPNRVTTLLKDKTVFNSHYEATGIYDVKTHHYYDVSEFQGQKSLVICGIARPYSFLNKLEQNNIDIKNKILFPDHNEYKYKEVQLIRKKFYETNSYSVLTTQKDAVKLTNFAKELDDIDIYYLKIELKIDEEEKFTKQVLKTFN